MVWYTPHDNPHDDPVLHWQSLVDRGLIGQRQETPPEVALNRARFEAYFLAPHRRPALPAGVTPPPDPTADPHREREA